MTAISNFTQAMRELTGYDDDPVSESQKKSEQEKTALQPEVSSKEPPEIRREKLNLNLPSFEQGEGSQITSTMVVKGRIDGNDPIKIEGTVLGDAKVGGSMIVSGKVVGEISSDNLFINGTIKGDIHGKTDIKINESAVVVGNIEAENLSAQGKIKGNLQVRGTTEISESALIVGDIITNDITSEKGCIINGKITTKDRMKFNFEDDKLFQITE